MKNLPSIKLSPFFLKIIFAFLSLFILNCPAFSGGWKSIGPTTGANAHIRSFAISSFTHKIYATTDSGIARRDHDSVWSMLYWNDCDPFEICRYYHTVWCHPVVDSAWFFGWEIDAIDPGPELAFAKTPESQWNFVWVGGGIPNLNTLTFHPEIPGRIYANLYGFAFSSDTG